jgi:general secretion pathway protein I
LLQFAPVRCSRRQLRGLWCAPPTGLVAQAKPALLARPAIVAIARHSFARPGTRLRLGWRGRRRSGQRAGGLAACCGFTLLEVVVAMAVLAVAFTAMLGLHVRSLKIAAREQQYTQALLLARTLLTDVELAPQLPAAGTSSGDFESRFPGRYPGFLWQQTVNEIPLLPDTREIVVRVQPAGDPLASAELTLYLRAGAT